MIRKSPLALAVASMLCSMPFVPAQAQEADLRSKLEALERQVQLLKDELNKLSRKTEQVDAKTEAIVVQQEAAAGVKTPGVTEAGTATITPVTPAMAAGQTAVFGYGEINYNRPRDSSQSQVTVRRAVIGLGHRFNDRLRFVGEFEFENAVVSSSDQGEAEVEQAYLDYRLTNSANIKAGLFLVPIGILNEIHEPTRYFGVERNDVETRVIPSTWREVGVGVYGQLDNGFYYDAGVTSGFNLHKWDAAAGPGSPLAAIHQEGQLAAAHSLGYYGAIRYLGIPGLRLGTGIWSGSATQGNGPFKAGNSSFDLAGISGRVTLWDMHAVWQPGRWDLRALYARGTIGQAKELNDVLSSPAVGFTSGFIPKSFDGWFLQAAYNAWESGDYAVKPFFRYERYNLQRSLAEGYESFADPLLNERVLTAGVSLFVTRNAVVKADYQRYRADRNRDRFNLGLGYNF